MEDSKTDRGFDVASFTDFNGDECSLQQSSLATDDCIWLGVNDAAPKIMASQAKSFGIDTEQTTGWIKYPIHKDVSLTTRMHLDRDQVEALLPYLHRFVDTGSIQ